MDDAVPALTMSATGTAPEFSVVIPVYNGATTIARAIDSVLRQSYSAREIIVVDDGSHDETHRAVRAYGDRVNYIWQTNVGPSVARNHGVEAASCEWIAFLDADDWYYPDRLLVHAEMIKTNPGLDFLVANFDYRDASGWLMHSSMSQSAFGRRLLATLGNEGQTIIGADDIGQYISAQFSDTRTLCVPRRTFLALGGFAADLRICEDVVFLLRLCARSTKAGVACRPLAAYSVHEQGLIRANRLRAQNETVRALLSLAREMTSAPARVRAAWRTLAKDAYLNLAYCLAKSGHRAEATFAVSRSLLFRPALSDLRCMISMLRG